MADIHGLNQAAFVEALRAEEIKRPFLVKESAPDQKPEWFLYAEMGRNLVQMHTMRGKPRFWRTLDGAFNDLQREMSDRTLPGITVYVSPDAVVLPLQTPPR